MKRQKQWTCEEKLSGIGLFGLEQKRLGGGTLWIRINTCWGEGKEDRARLCSVEPSIRKRGCVHKLKYRKCQLNIRKKKKITAKVTKQWNRLPMRVWSLSFWRYSKAKWKWPWENCSSWLSQSSGLKKQELIQPSYIDLLLSCHQFAAISSRLRVFFLDPRYSGWYAVSQQSYTIQWDTSDCEVTDFLLFPKCIC